MSYTIGLGSGERAVLLDPSPRVPLRAPPVMNAMPATSATIANSKQSHDVASRVFGLSMSSL
ncbi:hypothetical protein [Burkholderia ubonensis]|uniref:hypothetical protein n=1 Tax=Burkholderia ubonensis TaxID=101571 RepID=UPI0012F75BC0|nr:hypothetical protein [Burkholderia ubonensis]